MARKFKKFKLQYFFRYIFEFSRKNGKIPLCFVCIQMQFLWKIFADARFLLLSYKMRLFWAISTHCEVCISLSPEKLRQNSGRFWRFSFLYFFALQVELARKRGWKGYWVCLKGTTLLFYPCESKEGQSVEATPRHLIIVDGSIMQSIPEHPKRDFIFCLSTAFGDAYLFQVIVKVEKKREFRVGT